MATRTRLDTDARRAQLLMVGLELFGTRPYSEVSMSDVAKTAGVSYGLVYHYFPDKRRLFLGVVRHVAEQLVAATVADLDKPPMERLYDGMRAHLDFAEAYPGAYTAMINGGNGSDDEVRMMCEEFRWNGLSEIARTLGIPKPGAKLRLALRGWAGFQEGATIEWLKDRRLKREELLDLFAEALVQVLTIAGVDAAKKFSESAP